MHRSHPGRGRSVDVRTMCRGQESVDCIELARVGGDEQGGPAAFTGTVYLCTMIQEQPDHARVVSLCGHM